jgi:hypothetical protein
MRHSSKCIADRTKNIRGKKFVRQNIDGSAQKLQTKLNVVRFDDAIAAIASAS